MPFNTLPLELKQAIWEFALHAAVAEPEVCIIWPLNQPDFDQTAHPLLVDTAFPVLMHVCRAWRDFVLSSAQRPFSSSPIRFRFSRKANCEVPYRHFRGDVDALYASATNFEKAVQCLAVDWEPGVGRQALATVRHLALEWIFWQRAGYWLPELVFRGCPNLEKISVVFPSSRRAMWKGFQAPARRCKLRRIEGAESLCEKVAGSLRGPVSMQRQVDYGSEVAENQAPLTWENELAVHEMDMGEPGGEWFTGSAWDKEGKRFCLGYEAAAFVEYRKSGDPDGGETWVEACEGRLLVYQYGKIQEPPMLSPEQRRRSPEEWRVNDMDDYQH